MDQGVSDATKKLLEWMDGNRTGRTAFVSRKITTKDFEEAGRGLAAVDTINAHEEILRIPHSLLLNSHTIIKHIAQYNSNIHLNTRYSNVEVPYEKDKQSAEEITNIYRQISIEEMSKLSSFQLVGLYLCLEWNRKEKSFWKPFLDSLPDMEAFECSPLVWEIMKVENYQHYLSQLPAQVKTHAAKVIRRFKNDYKVVMDFIGLKTDQGPTLIPEELFLWAWMCINSRCLYMDLFESKDKSDNFTMAPYVDFINHSDNDHCRLEIDSKGFHVYTTSKYMAAEQLFLSYGAHSNGFLLCEYGFTMESNRWNDIDISEMLIKSASEEQIEFLKSQGYYDDYTISKTSGVSYRTEIALAVLQETHPKESRKLNAYITGLSDGESYGPGIKTRLERILKLVKKESEKYEQLRFDNNRINRIIAQLHHDLVVIAQETISTYID